MKKEGLVDFLLLILIFSFLLGYFNPRLLLSQTITTGGDTGSHYYTAVYLKEVLLPKGKIMGWIQGNYAGFPLFYHYFPLPFLLMVLISLILPMTLAFKLVSVLGIFLLPLCVYITFRLLKYNFPIPILGALFTLPFLFMEANSMWGANIPSTLAGEFSYGIGISLLFLFLGTLYAGIQEKKWVVLNAFLVFLLGLSHGYAVIFSGVIGSYFLFTKKSFWENFKYLFQVFGLGFLLLGFWIIPFLANLPWVTEYVTRWHISSIFEVFPKILWPGMGLTILALILNHADRRSWYFLYQMGLCFFLYLVSPYIGMLDIRFVPIFQIFIAIFGATFLLSFLEEIKVKEVLAAITFIIVILWTNSNVTYIRHWISWNYTGYEGKAAWPLFKKINDYLRQSNGGRVVYEHSPLNNTFGTERAFESLPFFAERKTLEGLYMQSSISSPFIFYLQSEVSKVCSGPFPQYQYTSLNVPSAVPKLKIFNVTQYIVRTPEAKKSVAQAKAFKLEKKFDDYEIYRLTANDGHYVVPLSFQPVMLKTQNWKKDFYLWFRNNQINDLYLTKDPLPNHLTAESLDNLPRIPIPIKEAKISEEVKEEEISFTTNLPGHPHLIKVSYHPNWQVEGAEKIYLVSPSLMLVFPKQSQVRLFFGKTIYNYLGEFFSFTGLLLIFLKAFLPKRTKI